MGQDGWLSFIGSDLVNWRRCHSSETRLNRVFDANRIENRYNESRSPISHLLRRLFQSFLLLQVEIPRYIEVLVTCEPAS